MNEMRYERKIIVPEYFTDEHKDAMKCLLNNLNNLKVENVEQDDDGNIIYTCHCTDECTNLLIALDAVDCFYVQMIK